LWLGHAQEQIDQSSLACAIRTVQGVPGSPLNLQRNVIGWAMLPKRFVRLIVSQDYGHVKAMVSVEQRSANACRLRRVAHARMGAVHGMV
jgi:hypothetical protein